MIHIVAINGGTIRVGVDAPKELKILRDEHEADTVVIAKIEALLRDHGTRIVDPENLEIIRNRLMSYTRLGRRLLLEDLNYDLAKLNGTANHHQS